MIAQGDFIRHLASTDQLTKRMVDALVLWFIAGFGFKPGLCA
jgi:hypothetical protein